MRQHVRFAFRLIVIASLITASVSPARQHVAVAGATRQETAQPGSWLRDARSGTFVYYANFYANIGEMQCRPATEEEALMSDARDPMSPLSVIPRRSRSLSPHSHGMLHIILRGADQLNNFPQARDAFLRAAALWESLIQAPITITIDVDYGPTRFGQAFPPGVVGLASSQQVGRSDLYRDIRDALIAGAGSAEELALYNSLPRMSVPTTEGNITRVFAPSAALRALGLLAPMADPDGEQAQLGPPPSIGFNSNPGVTYDFDPRDGITAGQVDFEAVAIHEIGHILGFTSFVGFLELLPGSDAALTLWDIYRFRPGEALPAGAVAPASFSDAERVLSSGGEQVFFAGGPERPLSTGRTDGSGGDGFQASHWKDDRFTGQIIGVMDPIITAGDRGVVSDSDLAVLNAIGYGANVADPGAPTITGVTYNGSALVIKGKQITGDLQLEINFEIVAPPLKIKPKPTGKKAKVKGSREQLNLQSGANQVRIIKDGLRSNVAILNL